MGFEHEVFVSYAHEDRPFATALVKSLRAAGLDPWLDDERIVLGNPVRQGLVEALKTCRSAVLVISDRWLDKAWTQWEGEVFFERGGAGRHLVLLLRVPRDKERLGPYLYNLPAVEWIGQPDDQDELFWRLVCGLRGVPPGPIEKWAEQGRAALGGKGPAILPDAPDTTEARAREQVKRGRGLLALLCDRDPQWGQLGRIMSMPNSHAVFVVGKIGAGHNYFLERILACLDGAPPRAIKAVDWGYFPPKARALYMDALAASLRCPVDRIVPTLAAQLARQNVVLLHRPVMDDAFDNDAFVDYFTKWLPELLQKADPDYRPDDEIGALKVVQAIAWPESGTPRKTMTRLASLFGVSAGGRLSVGNSQVGAERLLQTLRGSKQGPLSFEVLELGEITRAHVEQLCASLPPGVDRGRFVDSVMASEPDSATIVARIIERLSVKGDEDDR